MNARIKQLADQAGIHFHNGGTLDAGPNGIAKFVLFADMERFAELIIKECVGMLDDEDDYGPYSTGVRSAAYRIKKHFGVDE